MIKDKDVTVTVEELRKLKPEQMIDINEGILSLSDLKAAKNLDNLLVHMADCCLQNHSSLNFE